MSAAGRTLPAATVGAAPRRWLPALALALAWLALFGPTYLGLASTLWATDTNGHGPVILVVGLWLLWTRRGALPAPRVQGSWAAAVGLLLSEALWVFGRSQGLWTLEVLAQAALLAALLHWLWGAAAMRAAWFPVVFLVFMVPWPEEWSQALTQPLKAGVSAVATALLHAGGYPIARSGVVLVVGGYRLLVADACAGLNSLFTLEALGLLYLNLMAYRSGARNVALMLAVAPIAFAANVVRVVVLVLVTWHFGDAAGQGFAHFFAGMTLFMVALAIVLAVDRLFDLAFGRERVRASRAGSAAAFPAWPAGRAALAVATMLAAAMLAPAATPRQPLREGPQKSFAERVPERFGGWRAAGHVALIADSPELQQALDRSYDETLARAYRHEDGTLVMLSVSYHRVQGRDRILHRPEVCYAGQGFDVKAVEGDHRLALGARSLPVTRLMARGPRTEPVTYWLVVGDRVTRFGLDWRRVTLGYGLRGVLPDGVLVRVSTLGERRGDAFSPHERFARDLAAALPADDAARLFGVR